MPQMMPINWFISLFFFICIFIVFNIFNYYITSPQTINLNNFNSLKKNNMTWKW